jgi:methyl coenzyme M reductase subunit D
MAAAAYFSISLHRQYFESARCIDRIDKKISQIEVEIKCSEIILDYKKEKHFVEVFNIKQHVNNSNVFFGGKLIEGEYVITLTYVENGKKIKKIEKKLIKP